MRLVVTGDIATQRVIHMVVCGHMVFPWPFVEQSECSPKPKSREKKILMLNVSRGELSLPSFG